MLRDQFISEILDHEAPPAEHPCTRCPSQLGAFRCKECHPQDLFCHACCLTAHRNLPLHHIEKWTGKFFGATSLNQEGFVLYLGHGGDPCPAGQMGRDGEAELGSSDEDGDDGVDGVPLAGWEKRDARCLVIVDTLGIHQLRISWCKCQTAEEPHIQLLRNHFFPASVKWPSTAFTFSLLDYFHVDSVECKTSASSFFSKLRRLTNSSSPHSVPVCPERL